MLRKTIGLLFLAVSPLAIAQTSARHTTPRLVSAELPYYPAIAAAAHVTGSVKVQISVAKGSVTDAVALSSEAKDNRGHAWANGIGILTAPTLSYVRTWKFDPDVTDSFSVVFTYDIGGTETDLPTNPAVSVSPNLDVSIVARPVKPTVTY
jgi:hypothetical protein